MVRPYLTQGYRASVLALAASALAATLALSPTPAHAAIDYPVCLRFYGGYDLPSYDDCAYTSIAQCNMTARGLPAQCLVNPFYGQLGTPYDQVRKKRQRRAR